MDDAYESSYDPPPIASVPKAREGADAQTDHSTTLLTSPRGPADDGDERVESFIYDHINDGTFPKQIQLGSRTVVWNEQEVTKWMEDRMASR